MTLNITYTIAMALYALFALTLTITVFSLMPIGTEHSRKLVIFRKLLGAGITLGVLLVPGVMQLLLAAHPITYSVGVIIVLFRYLRKGDPASCMWSMTLLCSVVILSGSLQKHKDGIFGRVDKAISQPDFLGIK